MNLPPTHTGLDLNLDSDAPGQSAKGNLYRFVQDLVTGAETPRTYQIPHHHLHLHHTLQSFVLAEKKKQQPGDRVTRVSERARCMKGR